MPDSVGIKTSMHGSEWEATGVLLHSRSQGIQGGRRLCFGDTQCTYRRFFCIAGVNLVVLQRGLR